MGTHKLLLEIGGRTVIAHLLEALVDGGIEDRRVIVHPDDAPLADEIARHGGRPIIPSTPPAEMRDSAAIGVNTIASEAAAAGRSLSGDRPWFLIPADHPAIVS